MDKPSRWAINTITDLPASVHDRVALLGDAAHAMTTHQAQGAAQAIEDAYILASLLAHPLTTSSTVSEVLKIYEQVRLPWTNWVVKASAEQGKLYEFVDPRFEELAGQTSFEEKKEKFDNLVDVIVDNWKWSWETSADDDKQNAIGMLEKKLGKGKIE